MPVPITEEGTPIDDLITQEPGYDKKADARTGEATVMSNGHTQMEMERVAKVRDSACSPVWAWPAAASACESLSDRHQDQVEIQVEAQALSKSDDELIAGVLSADSSEDTDETIQQASMLVSAEVEEQTPEMKALQDCLGKVVLELKAMKQQNAELQRSIHQLMKPDNHQKVEELELVVQSWRDDEAEDWNTSDTNQKELMIREMHGKLTQRAESAVSYLETVLADNLEASEQLLLCAEDFCEQGSSSEVASKLVHEIAMTVNVERERKELLDGAIAASIGDDTRLQYLLHDRFASTIAPHECISVSLSLSRTPDQGLTL